MSRRPLAAIIAEHYDKLREVRQTAPEFCECGHRRDQHVWHDDKVQDAQWYTCPECRVCSDYRPNNRKREAWIKEHWSAALLAALEASATPPVDGSGDDASMTPRERAAFNMGYVSGQLKASATPRPEGEILCPFCGHDERDRINMKRHLIVGCRAFGYTPFASVASRPPGAGEQA